MDGNEIVALVERKTFDNVLSDFGTMAVLHQGLAELTTYERHALVVERLYVDFLNPKRVHHYGTVFCGRAIGASAALMAWVNRMSGVLYTDRRRRPQLYMLPWHLTHHPRCPQARVTGRGCRPV